MSIGLPPASISLRAATLAIILAAGIPAAAPARTLTTQHTANVTVRAAARWCEGAPRMRVVVDRRVLGTRLVRSPLASTFRFAAVIPAGVHKVRVTLVNPHRARGCRRALRVDRLRLVPTGAPAADPLAAPAPGGGAVVAAPPAQPAAPIAAPTTAPPPSAAPATEPLTAQAPADDPVAASTPQPAEAAVAPKADVNPLA